MIGASSSLFRLGRAGYILAREGVFSIIAPPADLPTLPRLGLSMLRLLERRGISERNKGERLSAALNRLGPSYVKMGQFLATRPDVVGPELAQALSSLQDRVPAFGMQEAKKVVHEALGKPIEVLFEHFSEPVAAASIAQVHKARVIDADGVARDVAVKVLRPHLAERFKADLGGFYLAARVIEALHVPSRRLRPVAVVDTLARSIQLEMDFRLEAAAMSEMGEISKDDADFRVPTVHWDMTAKSVLTMEWIDGIKLNDQEALKASGHDLKALGETVIQSFLRHALGDGFFHADMHPGNLFLDRDGKLVAVDFGIMGRIGPQEKRFLAEILYGFITRDYRRVSQVHFDAGYVPSTQDVDTFAQALRSIGEPIHGRDASEISMAGLLSQLFEFTEVFGMATRTELILLQKTMVVVEGVARMMDSNLNLWNTSEPVVKRWMESNLGPAAKVKEVTGGLASLGAMTASLPEMARRAERLSASFDTMGREGMRLEASTVAAIGRAEARESRSGRVALWVIALALSAIALNLWS
ncbi:2-polyprenylphenol 6-hydroxylase [Cohaesibacter celericrescens]|uniref:2-polyprenylphenol 6-hydroxylase n=1 Tax=Cohaesibacter celericrescens TaxID=2067669 RepID=A0A2N5XNU5_9HYPH|nr:2-polyprenylphenol 6-hydroxylase [Cohaesibacter celericrescens]PLW76189.1 2-polyprenylphenol 6-hydroxylase [Cohaesibacter celericrescens]